MEPVVANAVAADQVAVDATPASDAPSSMWTQVEKVMKVIRPAMQADGGDIRLVDIDEPSGVVKVELLGACGDCPVSEQDLKLGVERIMVQRVPGVTAVVNAALVEELPQVSETTFELKGFSR